MDKKILERLSNAVGIGHLDGATAVAKEELQKYAEVTSFGSIGLVAKIDRKKEKTLMLEAHLDEVGFIVTHVFENGFLKVSNVGGNDGRILPATPVIIHGKSGDLPAVFASNPPHLNGETEVKTADEALLDTGLDKKAKELVSPGDFVTYDRKFTDLAGSRISGKSLDDRAAVACLIEVASRVYDKDLPVNVIFCLSEQEELGTRGAKTAAFALSPDEAVAVDVSFGNAPDVAPTKSGKLGGGAMIGISPILNRKISNKLSDIAKEKEIPHQFEVMGGTTSTDADVISVSKEGIPCGLLSIPLRNMHTPAEVADMADLDSVSDILEAYLLSGGAL